MPTEDNVDDILELEVTSLKSGVNVAAFASLLRRTVEILQQLNIAVSRFGGTESIEWQIVKLQMSSPLVATLEGVPGDRSDNTSKHVISLFVRGISSLAIHEDPPRGFSEAALRETANLLAGSPQGITSIKFAHTSKSGQIRNVVQITKTVVQHADFAQKLLQLDRATDGGDLIEYGTLEGTLRDLFGSKNRAVLVDELTNKQTSCYFDEQNDKTIRLAWKGRVAMTGKIIYDRHTREPLKLFVEEIRLLGISPPQIDDFIDLDLTGGSDSADVVRRLRDDD